MAGVILRKFINSYKFANEGIEHAFKTQNSFRIQLLFAAITICAAVFFEFNHLEWIILMLTISMVLSAELINTVIETLVDLYTNEYHEKAKLAKDLSAGVVLLICFFAILIGLILFIPHIFSFAK